MLDPIVTLPASQGLSSPTPSVSAPASTGPTQISSLPGAGLKPTVQPKSSKPSVGGAPPVIKHDGPLLPSKLKGNDDGMLSADDFEEGGPNRLGTQILDKNGSDVTGNGSREQSVADGNVSDSNKDNEGSANLNATGKDNGDEKSNQSKKGKSDEEGGSIEIDLESGLEQESGNTNQENGKQNFPKQARDLTAFKPEHHGILKALNNKQFAEFSSYLQGVYKLEQSHEELKSQYEQVKSGKLPESWVEHPEAYTLSPEFTKIKQDIQYGQFEENHYTDQLQLIEEGKPWKAIKGYDKNGRPVFVDVPAPEQGVDTRAKIQITKMLAQSGQYVQNETARLQMLRDSHVNEHKQMLELTRKAEDHFFPQLKDEAKIPKEFKGHMDVVMSRLHPSLRKHPLARLLAKSYAGHIYQAQKIARLSAQDATKKSIANDLKKGSGPTGGQFQGAGGNNNGQRVLDVNELGFKD